MESVASRASDMLIYNRPYIILVATGDRAYVEFASLCSILNIWILSISDKQLWSYQDDKVLIWRKKIKDGRHDPDILPIN